MGCECPKGFRYYVGRLGRWMQLWSLGLSEDNFKDILEGMPHMTVGEAIEHGHKLAKDKHDE